MKISYYFILIVLLFLSCEKEKEFDWFSYQNYIPFPENDILWIKKTDGQIAIPPDEIGEEGVITGEFVTYEKYFFENDTNINDIYYRKTYKKLIDTTKYYENNITEITDSVYYIGALRQNIDLKKVFFVPLNQTKEEILYDFNINLGDTLVSYLCSYRTYSVSCIDSILINNRYHQIYYLRQGDLLNSAFMIEGIGNPHGPFRAFAGPGYNGSICEFYYKDIELNIDFPVMCPDF